MSPEERIRRQQILERAEGYLELGMPEHTLAALAELGPQIIDGKASYLSGEALRALDRHADAVPHFELARNAIPDDIHILLALAWCYKRTRRIDRAIEALERALEIDPGEAILYYNLACYWSLVGNRHYALRFLARALAIDGNYRDLVFDEPDFAPLRDDPDFQELVTAIV